MLRYHILVVFGIFLILSIINFALTAPVLVQRKRPAYVDMVDIPKDVILKRGDGDMAKLAEEYFETWGKPIESSDTHSSSSTAPNPASSTTNPDPPCSPSMQGLGARGPWPVELFLLFEGLRPAGARPWINGRSGGISASPSIVNRQFGYNTQLGSIRVYVSNTARHFDNIRLGIPYHRLFGYNRLSGFVDRTSFFSAVERR